MQITIIGAGNMPRGIGTRAVAGGHSLRLTDKDPAKAKALAEELRQRVPGADVADSGPAAVGEADIVVLALPFPAGKEVAATYRERLAGKTVVDIGNPVDFVTFDSLVVPPGTSAAEQIAAAAPGARVIKAFNTTFAGTLVAGEAGGTPLDVFIAGDDAAAKQAVADLASSGGLRPIDAGPLSAPASWKDSSSCT